MTPAMALGVTDHVWSIGELVEAALDAPPPPPLQRLGQRYLPGMSARQATKASKTPFRIIRGGLS